jgi:catechol 2,3-dioxygenase-like lactoylglutathione lyase family enzyme
VERHGARSSHGVWPHARNELSSDDYCAVARVFDDNRQVTATDPAEQLVVEIMVRDLEQSLALYTALGFKLERRDGGFAELSWESRRLFLDERPDLPALDGPARGNVRIMTADVDAIWALTQSLGMAVERPIADRYYGLRDFTVLDLDGFGLRFASPLAGESGSHST